MAKRAHDTFLSLTRYMQNTAERAFPVTEARIMSPAMPPLIVGCFLGVALALARERFDHSIQTRKQLENDAGLRVLGFLPVIESWRAMVRAPLIDLRHFSFSWPRIERLARIFDDRSGGAAEMLFGLKLVIDDNVESQSAKVIGITSPRAGDGKTTLAFNLASSIAAGLTSLQAEVAHIMAVVRTRLADMDVTYNVDPATISRLQRGCHDRASRPHDRRQLSPPAKDMSDADIIIFVSRHVR